jgi:hypothetical protein
MQIYVDFNQVFSQFISFEGISAKLAKKPLATCHQEWSDTPYPYLEETALSIRLSTFCCTESAYFHMYIAYYQISPTFATLLKTDVFQH